ncbi:MAG: PHP domain-containing protein [Monoglobaceae bacterium]
MKIYYDLHIHSALSPCGDNDMTPNNIVNMSILKGLDAIAITDHNACGNVRAAMKVAEDKIIVIPGMEIETAEEVHMVSLFPDIESAEEMERIIRKNSIPVENKVEIFGNQYYMNENDEIIGEEPNLLVTATGLDIYSVVNNVKDLGGVVYPAHIDRSSYSVLSNLGFIPPDLNFTTVEITAKNREKMEPEYSDYDIVTSSDAHYLWDISEKTYNLDICDKNIDEILSKLSDKKIRNL